IRDRNVTGVQTCALPISEDINVVADRFGAERVIAENVVYRSYEGDMLRPIIDPDVIARIIRETGCGFLLDTAHARMTCKYLEARSEERRVVEEWTSGCTR